MEAKLINSSEQAIKLIGKSIINLEASQKRYVEIEIVAFGKRYFMLQYNGCEPFVMAMSEVNRYLKSKKWRL